MLQKISRGPFYTFLLVHLIAASSGSLAWGQPKLLSGALREPEVVFGTTNTDTTNPKDLLVNCPDGKIAVGGGAAAKVSFFGEAFLTHTHPSGNGWLGRAVGPTGEQWNLGVFAVCVTVGGGQ
jgi:hypothetical protein